MDFPEEENVARKAANRSHPNAARVARSILGDLLGDISLKNLKISFNIPHSISFARFENFFNKEHLVDSCSVKRITSRS